MVSIGVIGAGSWGTTLANMLAAAGHDVILWVYEEELREILETRRRNTFYLPDFELDCRLAFTGSLSAAVSGRQLILWVTPVKAFREIFRAAWQHCSQDAIHLSASKGIEIETLKTVSQIAQEAAPEDIQERFGVLSGPSFAREVSAGMPTAVVVAARSQQTAQAAQQIMATPFFRTYTSSDIIGVELGGALKNVIAIASGVAQGLHYGHNTQAALITRGLAEIVRLGTFCGADALTFAGLSGMGDLVLTCTSRLSRNYSLGLEIGKGKSLATVLEGMTMIAEGIYTAKAARRLSQQHNIDMPIVQEIYNILFENKPPLQAVRDLMGRDLKQETV